MSNPYYKHPELDGNPFLLQAGEPAVLLIHSFTATTSEVRPLVEFLYLKGLTVSAPLLAGHGTHHDDLSESKWQDWYQSAESAYLSFRADHDKVWVGGESMGGVLALMLAANHPEIAGLVLYVPALKTRRVWLAPLLKHFTKYIKKVNTGPDLAWSGYNVYPTRGMEQLLALQTEARAALKLVTQPSLIVMAKQDGSVPFSVASLLCDQLTSNDKEFVILEDSPHVILLANRQMEARDAAWNFLSTRISAASNS
jgi:carboxylesterase